MSEESVSEAYAPELIISGDEQEPFREYRRRVQKPCQNSIQGKQTEEENLKYSLFMDYHSKIFISKEKRKSTRIFKSLSKFLKTRTPRQCRSHFQKIIGKYKTVKKVKQYYQDLLGVITYQQRFDQVAKELSPQLIKVQDKDDQKCKSTATTEVQTDPLIVTITDLPQNEFAKLINIVSELHKSQFPFWMHPSYLPTPSRTY